MVPDGGAEGEEGGTEGRKLVANEYVIRARGRAIGEGRRAGRLHDNPKEWTAAGTKNREGERHASEEKKDGN